MSVPNTFATATTAIPLTNLDANFQYYDNAYQITSTSISFTGAVTLAAGTANGVPYLNGSKVLTTGSALTFDGVDTFQLNAANNAIVLLDGSGTNNAIFRLRNKTTGELAGIFANNSKQLVFEANGAVEQMRLTSTGLGIGTSSPANKLDVVGTGNFSGSLGRVIVNSTVQNSYALQVSSTNGTSAQGVDIDSRSPTGVAGNQTALRIRNDANVWMLVDAFNGNVGIGTSSPGYRLDVRRDSATWEVANLENQTAGAGALLRFKHANSPINGYDIGAVGGADALVFRRNSTEQMRINSSGNLGLGVTPSAFGGGRWMQFLSTTAVGQQQNGTANLVCNAFESSVNAFSYIASAAAARYNVQAGAHAWFTAPSGTAGNAITFTQAMTLDAYGNVQLGTTNNSGSGRRLIIKGSGPADGSIILKSSSTAEGGNSGFLLQSFGTNSEAYVWNFENQPLIFGTNNTERARIDSSGNLIQSAPTTPPSLATNGQMVFNLTSNTNLRVSVRGSDGVTRTANITLA